MSAFVKNNLSGPGNAFIIGAILGIMDAIYRLTAESLKGHDDNEESEITNKTLEELRFNQYPDETIKFIMETRFKASSDYYAQGQGIPIFQIIGNIAEEIVVYYNQIAEHYGLNNINSNYETIKKSLIDYQISVSNAIQTKLAKQ